MRNCGDTSRCVGRRHAKPDLPLIGKPSRCALPITALREQPSLSAMIDEELLGHKSRSSSARSIVQKLNYGPIGDGILLDTPFSCVLQYKTAQFVLLCSQQLTNRLRADGPSPQA